MYIGGKREEFEYTKGAIRIRIEEKQTTQWPKEKVQKDKQKYSFYTPGFVLFLTLPLCKLECISDIH